MSLSHRLRSTLSHPTAYVLFQRLVWGRALREMVTTYIRPKSGQRLLDMGCGPADILRLMTDVDYVGFDHDRRYVEAARRRFGTRARLMLAEVGSVPEFAESAYDVVLAKGLLHHIDDREADRLFRIAHRALRPGGRLVTVDGCFHTGQRAVHRKITALDRGEYIRSPEDYRSLAAPTFTRQRLDVRDDLLRIPYSLVFGVFER